MNAMNVREAINRRMTYGSGNCPSGDALGECAAVYQIEASGPEPWWMAHLYLWTRADGLAPAEVAAWFEELGAKDVCVRAVLHDPDNNILNAYSTDDAVRPWDVTFRLTPQCSSEENPTDRDAAIRQALDRLRHVDREIWEDVESALRSALEDHHDAELDELDCTLLLDLLWLFRHAEPLLTGKAAYLTGSTAGPDVERAAALLRERGWRVEPPASNPRSNPAA